MVTGEQAASAAGAAVAGAGTWWSFVSQAADVVFGLPIQVVLACLFGAAAARTYLGSVGFLNNLLLIAVYGGVGAYSVPLVLHLFGLPTSVSAGVGILISGGIQIPAIRDWIADTVKSIFQKKTGAPPASGPGGTS